jgi:inner membrane protein
VISHAVAGAAVTSCLFRPGVPKSIILAGAVCAALPDIDVIGFGIGVPYGSFWGHRGFTHSIVFAAMLAALVIASFYRHGIGDTGPWLTFVVLFIATAGHGLLDALTDGGYGAALLAPFRNERFFFPCTPIRVSPIGIASFFTHRGWVVLQSEMLWVWLPSAALVSAAWALRWRTASSTS